MVCGEADAAEGGEEMSGGAKGRPLRTLFYGMSHEHAPGKMDTLRRLGGDFEIVAIADDRGRGSPTYHTDPFDGSGYRVVGEEEALGLEGIDVVFVETANRDLMEVAEAFARRGVAMHCDKPCGENMEDYRRVAEICRANGTPMQIGYMYRGNPAIKFMRKAFGEGWIGETVFAEADMNHSYGNDAYQLYTGTMRGGILYNLGCHLIDTLAHFVKGTPKRVTTVKGRAPGDPEGALNRMSAFLEFEGAEMLVRSCSRAPGGVGCRSIRVDGTLGTMELCPIERFDGGELKLKLSLAKAAGGYGAGEHEISFGVQTDRYAAQLLELAAVVRGEAPDETDWEHDLRVHEMTLAASGAEF